MRDDKRPKRQRLIPAQPPRKPPPFVALRGSFLAGLVVVAPIGITVWLIWTLTGWMDSWVLPMIPARLRPEQYIGLPMRGVGVIIFLLFTILIGWLAKGWAGRALLRMGERLLDRMPIIGSVYGGLKQIAETIFSQGDSKFDRACLIEYPRRGVWALAFISGSAKGEVARHAQQNDADQTLLAVFLPTTPNPTSGFLLFIPEEDVHVLDMNVEDAAKLIISAGLVYPPPSESAADPNSAARSTESL